MAKYTRYFVLWIACAHGQITTQWITDEPTISPSFIPSSAPSEQTTSRSPSLLPSASPTNAPSMTPSSVPSDFPSLVPSDFPSLVPSTPPSSVFVSDRFTSVPESSMPSDMPSMVPSTNPSSSPSDIPSTVPSDIPSLFPSDAPSDIPSLLPSSNPSMQPSFSPSSLPSLIPSFVPSLSPSESPSDSPTELPSSEPSSHPSAQPSAAPSDKPSSSPSNSPSSIPSASPSVAPSARPSASPSLMPTTSPTEVPSSIPSVEPTDVPTKAPSAFPTSQPSVSPSSSPSSAPTETCHDVRTYKSPINNFTCSDHNGTDCVQWRHLGLTVDEVESLVENCPVSCGVQCGSALRFETIFSFKLWNIDEFLSPKAVAALNDVAVQFMTDYVSDLEPDSRFFVYETVLLSQQFAGNDKSRRRLRSLEDVASNSLLVDLEFRGYAINLGKVTIDSRLREGLFSPAFTLALQRSGDEYVNTQVDVIGSLQPLPSSSENSGRGASTAGISAAILGSVAIVVAGGFYFFRSRRAKNNNKILLPENHAVLNHFPASPNQSILSPASSFSFDATSNLVNRMARIVTSFSPRSSNPDDDGTKAELTNSDSSESNGVITNNADIDMSNDLIEEGIEDGEERSYIEEDAEEEIHPYTGIIPPMIVIDRIDSDPDIYIEDAEGYVAKVKTVVPTMRLEASSDLIAALNDRSKPFDPATFSSFIESNKPVEEDHNGRQDDIAPIQGGGSSFNLFSSNEDDDNSTKASNPDSSDALFDRLREGSSSRSDDPNNTASGRLDLRGRQPMAVPVMSRPPRVPSEGSAPNQRTSPRSANTSPILARDKATVDGYFSDDNTAKERVSKRDMPGFLHSLWSKSPHNRSYPPAPKSDTSGDSIKRWGNHRRSNSRGSYGTLGSLEEDGTVLTFHAPKGQLGLVIECNGDSAPVIAKVKDYSPLLDQVLPGDKIVMIDSTFTDKLGMSEVMSLLEGKSNRATSVRLKVFRSNDGLDTSGNPVRSPTVSHVSFDGTGSLGTMSDQESPVHFGHQMVPSPLASIPLGGHTRAGIKRSHSEAEIQKHTE